MCTNFNSLYVVASKEGKLRIGGLTDGRGLCYNPI